MKITIVDVDSVQKVGTHREYCERQFYGDNDPSLLGNIFLMRDDSELDEVCDKYQILFDWWLETNDSFILPMLNRLVEISKTKDIELAVFNSHKRTHAETIKNYLESCIDNDNI